MDFKNKPAEQKKKLYTKPKIETLGHMAQVTQKSGVTPDMNQTTKPSSGSG